MYVFDRKKKCHVFKTRHLIKLSKQCFELTTISFSNPNPAV